MLPLLTGAWLSRAAPWLRWPLEAAVTVLYKDEIFASDNIVNATKAKAAAYAKEVCSAEAAVANGAADAVADAATARAVAAQALDMLASKRAVRLAKKHGNITL